MRASDQINVNILKRHIMGEIELQGGFHHIRQLNHPADLYAVAWARNWYEGHCYAEEYSEAAIVQLFKEFKEQASYDDE
jgi:hypothetical protein